MKVQEVTVRCIGYEVAADVYHGEKADRVVLFLVGFGSSKANYGDLAGEITMRTGFSSFVLEYSGHGTSTIDINDITPAQNFLEVITFFDWLRKQHPKSKITVVGTSYGGFLATQLTKYRQFEKLILRVPAIYPPEDFYTKWGEQDLSDPLNYKQEYRNDPDNLKSHPLLKRAQRFTGNVYVLTHELDESCPKATTDAFIEAFKPVDTYDAKGFRHGFRQSMPDETQIAAYHDTLEKWIQE